MSPMKQSFWQSPLTRSSVPKDKVTTPETLLGYLIGPFGALLSSGIFTSYLQVYLGEALGLSSAYLSVLQLVSTFLIVAANLIVGQLIERTRTMAGKARPWLLLSALTLSIASVLMFIMPFEGTARYVWIAIAYNLYYAVAYPIYNTANATMVPVSTRDSEKRSVLASMSNFAGLGVMGAGSMVFPILVQTFLSTKDEVTGADVYTGFGTQWFIVMLAVAIFTALTVILQFKFTRERVTEELMESNAKEEKKQSVSVGQQLKAVTSEKWWWVIIVFYLLFQWAGAVKNGSMAYFCSNVLGGNWYMSILSILGAVPMAIAAAFVVPLANKFSKQKLTLAGLALGVVGGVIAGLGGNNLVVVGIGIALKCLGSSPACYLILAMLADVIDHVEYKHGIRTDGLTMSIYSSLMVAATPIGGAIIQALNGMLDAGTAASVNYIWIETIAYAVCAVLMIFFGVERNLKAEQQEIANRVSK